MPLKIERIELLRVHIPLVQPFVISLGPQYEAQNVFVRILTEGGIEGWGECSPNLQINGESADTCYIVGQYMARVLRGMDALDIAGCTRAMNRVIVRNESIKSAFDMALYDIAAREAQMPLYRFLGGVKNKIIATDMTVGLGDPKKMATEALDYKNAGFPTIKVKLGTTKDEDVARIKAIREVVGMQLPLRVDANQGWEVPVAIETLQALEQFDIEHCEEPIPRWKFMELRSLRSLTRIKIMADESCFDQYDAERLAKLQAVDYFNIKLGKSAGLYNAMQMLKVAEEHKIHLQVGCFMESRLAITALIHYAYCSDWIVHYDLDAPLFLKEDPIEGGMVYTENGVVEINESHGLGAKPKSEYITKAEKWGI